MIAELEIGSVSQPEKAELVLQSTNIVTRLET